MSNINLQSLSPSRILVHLRVRQMLVGGLVIIGLYFASRYSYVLFHTLVELFSIIIGWGLFLIVWNARRWMNNRYFFLLGTALVAAACLDLVHTLAYKGMNLFPGYDSNLPTQLWIAARYLQSLSMLLAPLLLVSASFQSPPDPGSGSDKARHTFEYIVVASYAAAVALLLFLIFLRQYPVCYIEGQGLTAFKKVSEVVISLILLASMAVLWSRRQHFDRTLLQLLMAATVATILSELAFIFYVDVYGLSNLIGHFGKLAAFVLIYMAVIRIGLQRPYGLIFKTLQESEERFRATIEQSFDGIMIADDAFRIIEWNASQATIFGFTRAEMIGKPLWDFLFAVLPDEQKSPHKRDAMKEQLRILGKHNGFSWMDQLRTAEVQHKDGSRRTIQTSSFPIEVAGEKLYCAITRDLSAQRKAEQDYQLLFREMLGGFALHEIILDDQGKPVDYRFLSVNPAFERLTGLKDADIRGRTILEVLPGTEKNWIETYGQVAISGEPANFENYSQELGKHYEVTAFRPSPGQFAVIFADITQRKQDEDALRQQSEDMAQLLAYSQDFLQTSAADIDYQKITDNILKISGGKYAAFNLFDDNGMDFQTVALSGVGKNIQKAASILGFEIVGKQWPQDPVREQHIKDQIITRFATLLDLTGNVIPPSIMKVLKKAFNPGETVVARISIGEKSLGDFTIIMPPEINFAADHLVSIYTRQVGLLLQRRQSEMEKEIMQKQLLQAQKMESVGRLAGGIAHDFNNKLGVIMGHAESALTKIPPHQAGHQDLRDIIRTSRYSADLVSQLLAFARKGIIRPRVLNLNDTTAGIMKMLKRTIGVDIELVWHPGSEMKPVFIDPSQVDQVLANLLVNARDAIAGEGKIVVETNHVVVDETVSRKYPGLTVGEYALLTVSDTGSGMDEETLAHIFEPFYTTKEMGKGTGLGLATVFGIIKQNNGNIFISSKIGEGTTIKIYLPICDNTVVPTLTAKKETGAQGGNETLLLIDDEEDLLQLVADALEDMGYTVLTASTPAGALRLAQEHAGSIDLLITDVVLPKMNGSELAHQIQLLQPELKCLFMSGYTAEIIADHGVLDEDTFFIQKPFLLKDLANKVRQMLEK